MAQRRWGNSPIGGDDTIFPVAAATPTFNPIAGTYSAAQFVSMSSTTLSNAIYYTTDNSTPTFPITGTTQLYLGPVTVSSSETLKAIAIAASYFTSAIGSAAYIISGGGGFGPGSLVILFPINMPPGVNGQVYQQTMSAVGGGTINAWSVLVNGALQSLMTTNADGSGTFNWTPPGTGTFTITFGTSDGTNTGQIVCTCVVS